MISEETAIRLAEALEESNRHDREIRAYVYYNDCMKEDGRFMLSPEQRERWSNIKAGKA